MSRIRYRTVVLMAMFVAVGLMGASFGEDSNVFSPTPMPLQVPVHFPSPVYDIKSNPITKEGFELGRKLFYDRSLSRNGTISCGFCHVQGSAFTHHGHDLSHGIDDQLGTRNTPAIMNLAWSKFFFWDGGVFHLDLQPIAPIENPVEMDASVASVMEKIKANENYQLLFKKAFGDQAMTSSNMLKALSQFMLQCISADSKYDSVKLKKGVVFEEKEKLGFELFTNKCASCHAGELFTDNKFHNNGLSVSMLNDSGRYRITLRPSDWYTFKTPSLRNVAKTSPYMHDGRFKTMEEVLDHYDHGVVESATLDPILKTSTGKGIPLSISEKQALIAFLNTLTDERFTRDPKLAEQ